jgi:two-component system CheB/CheR fusion protein
MNEQGAQPFQVVGVGASAGGLEALTLLLAEVGVDTPFAWVIVTHLAPDHDTLLHDILARRTPIPIELVENEVELQPGHGYVIPPGQEMIVSQGRLLLTERDRDEVPNLPIDAFLRSLASEFGRQAIAVILSGTGRDGQRGVEHVREQGGFVVAQSRDEARFPAMPLAALETGKVHRELPAARIAACLNEHAEEHARDGDADDPRSTDLYPRIFRAIRQRLRVDFHQYKLSTVSRRVDRRMAALHLSSLGDYADLLERDDGEVDALYAELLIGVTRFFRDPEAWKTLRDQVGVYRRDHAARDELRAWCVACATGEEAYTLAICLAESFRDDGLDARFRLFATDIHRGSLEVASSGRYPVSALAHVPPDLVKRYFRVIDADTLEVVKDLRDRVVFANHDVTRDPPFTRMDLITCRNLLIYFRSLTQRRVMTLFHFSLRTSGLLMLGPSETSGPLDDEFTTVDRPWRLFRKRRDVRLHPDFRSTSLGDPLLVTRPRRGVTSPVDAARRLLVASHAPPSVLVGSNGHVVHTFAGGSRYLEFPDGAPTQHVLELLEGDLKNAVSAALQTCRRASEPVVYRGVRHRHELVDVRATPLAGGEASGERTVVLSFETRDEPAPVTGDDVDAGDLAAARLRQLEQELYETRENLNTALEEMETSNEELQATNEELLASNEELQATNEELNSVNEELYSVNEEYQDKIEELQQLSNDMEHILRAGEVNLLFLDRELRIRTFTPGMASILGLVEHDQGRSYELFSAQLKGREWDDRVRSVLRGDAAYAEEVSGPGGVPYLLRLQPYRPDSYQTRGLVIVLSDLREVKAAEAERVMLARMIESSTDFIGVMQCDGKLARLNRGAREMLRRFGVDKTVSRIQQLFDERGLETFERAMTTSRADGSWRGTLELRLGDQHVPVAAAIDYNPHGAHGELYTVICHDVSELMQAQQRLLAQDRNKDRFLASLSHELRNPTSALFRAVDVLEQGDETVRGKALAVARRQLRALKHMLDDLLDASRIAAGRIDLKRSAVALPEVVQGAVDTVRHIHPSAVIEVDELPAAGTMGDATRLEQVVTNLLTNAVKYGEGHPVRVALRVVDDEVYVDVRDEGIGVSPDDMARVFEPFFRAHDSDASGMGIGLALSRDLARMHEGRIEVRSDGAGEGATFSLVVPRLDEEQGASADSEGPEEEGPTVDAPEAVEGPLDVVVVDDNIDAAVLLSLALDTFGHTARVGHCLADARRLLEERVPDVTIVDLQLPDGTGIELARELADSALRPPRLYALSGLGQPEDLAATAEAGFDLHLVKPIDLDELERVLAGSPPSH